MKAIILGVTIMLILLTMDLYKVVRSAAKRVAEGFERWMNTPYKTFEERYLEQARDIYDLEARMRHIDSVSRSRYY
jgi:hypothetical protein